MANGIPTTNILQPGNISLSSANRALISQLQLLTPQYYKQYVEKYGNEDFTWWLATYGGMEEVKNQEFFWFENRGKLMQGITLAAGGTSTSGSTVTCTLAASSHYNSGTETPLRVGETLRQASSDIEFEIIAITGTTANAWTFTVRPKQAITVTLAADDVMLFGGIMDAGEASDSNAPLIHLDEKFTNTITEMRESWSATDLAEMAEVFYDSGVSGNAPVGQAGTSYFTYKGLVKTNQRFINNVEFKLMRGNTVTNTGLNGSNSVGTKGFIPQVIDDGETVGYTAGNIDIAKMHEINRIMDVNGGAKENLWLQDIYQRQSFSDGIFKEFPAGAWVWGSNEKSQEAAINYGVESIMVDGRLFKVKKYKQFNTEAVVGLTPSVDKYRNFGIICPQGSANDAKDSTKQYKNLQVMYQEPPKGGTVGNGIRVWQHGGGSMNPTNGKMEDKVEMITYRGLRGVALNQFVIVQSV